MGWGSGPVTAIKRIQQCLGCKADGIVGPKTLAALNGDNKEEIFNRLWTMRKEWLIRISKIGNNKKYLKGWLRRLDSIKFEP